MLGKHPFVVNCQAQLVSGVNEVVLVIDFDWCLVPDTPLSLNKADCLLEYEVSELLWKCVYLCLSHNCRPFYISVLPFVD